MSKYIAGIDIGGTSVKFGVLEEGRHLLYKVQRPSVIGDPTAMVDLIADLIETSPYPISMIGVGTPGTVLLPQNLVTATNLKWNHAPLRSMICRRLHLPAWVDNDAQTQLAAEWADGACKGLNSVIYLTFGTGVGGAMLLNGKPWRGHLNTAGELGHIITHADGLTCSCGNRGCYEMYASATALVRMGSGQLTAKEIIDRARSGDEDMVRIFNQYLHEMAIGIASYNMIFCPEAIVLGGGISAAGDILLHGLHRAMREVHPNYANEVNQKICLAVHRNDAGIRGAAVLASINL